MVGWYAAIPRLRLGFALALIGGIIILLCGIVFVAMSSELVEKLGEQQLEEELTQQALSTVGILGIVLGILVIVGAILARYRERKILGGMMAIIGSLLSLFSGGGLIVGMLLGISGGALILAAR